MISGHGPSGLYSTMTVLVEERNMSQCEAVCPKHGVRCKLNMYEQNAFPMHAHTVDGKTCVWKK
jgi:hypothetical protein